MTQTSELQALLGRFHHIQGRITAQGAKLLAVSKKQPLWKIRALYAAGQRDFAESYLSESEEKIHQLDDLPDICWHFIGPLQSNKTRRIATLFSWVHSVDRLKIALRLQQQRPASMPPLQLCIQVRISDEPQKQGLEAAALADVMAEIKHMPRLRLRGFMGMPAHGQAEQAFSQLAACYQRWQQHEPALDVLSMGMSQDYEIALRHGASHVRLGAALFGPRD